MDRFLRKHYCLVYNNKIITNRFQERRYSSILQFLRTVTDTEIYLGKMETGDSGMSASLNGHFFEMIGIRISDSRSLAVHEINRRILAQRAFIGSFGLPWSGWSWINDPHLYHPKGTHLILIVPKKGSYLISSHLISSHLISSHLVSSRLVSSRLVSSHLILSYIILSFLCQIWLTNRIKKTSDDTNWKCANAGSV